MRILLVDDHEVVREGVKKIFDEHPKLAVEFGEASNPAQAVQMARAHDWDVVVLDLSLGDRSGLEVIKELKKIRPRLPILILSMHSEEQYARRAFKAGAAGYITKDSPRDELFQAIQKVVNRGRYVSPALAEKLVVDLGRAESLSPQETLSDREFQVLRLIASGKTVGEVAKLLCLSDKTISTYRARILEKMHMKTNAELTHYAIQNKLVD